MQIPGFRIPLHTALIAPLLVAGAPRLFAILNATLGAAIVLGLHAYYTLPLFIVTHFIGVILAKRDPDFFEVFIRCLRKKKFYHV
ncbi:MAG: conjugal transfer protein TrbD [marine bacterium B5-7]|nr:MAG: conjugal transfer protein TrbD [marine bacterium B5-7]